jgi:hypothetical protein
MMVGSASNRTPDVATTGFGAAIGAGVDSDPEAGLVGGLDVVRATEAGGTPVTCEAVNEDPEGARVWDTGEAVKGEFEMDDFGEWVREEVEPVRA